MPRPHVLLLYLPLLFACAHNRALQLSERADQYNQNVRWASAQGASMFFAKAQRRELMEKLGRNLGDTKVVEYGILDIAFDAEQKKASVMVDYSYYGNDQSLKKRTELQFWEYADKDWFLTRAQDVAPKKTP